MNDAHTRNADDKAGGQETRVFRKPEDRLCPRALLVSLVACIVPLVYAGLAVSGVFAVPWNASWPFLAPFFGGGMLAIASLILSLTAWGRHRSRTSFVATVFSLLAFPATLFSSWFVGLLSIAAHPV